ncbi:MAG: hypothetical protein QXO86_07415 [Nitrososphaerota archaeon]
MEVRRHPRADSALRMSADSGMTQKEGKEALASLLWRGFTEEDVKFLLSKWKKERIDVERMLYIYSLVFPPLLSGEVIGEQE